MAKSTSTPSSRSQPVQAQPERSGNVPPVFTTRHRGLKAAVWRNETAENGPMYNTTVSRTYKDGDEFRDTGSFGYDDILIVAELLRTCHGFISRALAKANGEAPE